MNGELSAPTLNYSPVIEPYNYIRMEPEKERPHPLSFPLTTTELRNWGGWSDLCKVLRGMQGFQNECFRFLLWAICWQSVTIKKITSLDNLHSRKIPWCASKASWGVRTLAWVVLGCSDLRTRLPQNVLTFKILTIWGCGWDYGSIFGFSRQGFLGVTLAVLEVIL